MNIFACKPVGRRPTVPENADRGRRCGKGVGPASGWVLALPSESSLSVAMPPGSVGAERIEPATAAGASNIVCSC